MYTQTFSTCKGSRFIKVHSVPCCPDSWYTNRSVLCFIAENPRRIESNSTACLQRHRDIYRSHNKMRHMSWSIDHRACSSSYGGRWNDNKFDTASFKIWLTKLIQFSLDQTTWDASENKLSTVKTLSYLALYLAVVGGSHILSSVLLSPVSFDIFSCCKQQYQPRCVLQAGVFPKQELLTRPAETAYDWQNSKRWCRAVKITWKENTPQTAISM